MEELDVAEQEDRHPDELSGGELQRVAIARTSRLARSTP
jgi:ABC-type polar amino acid transport system ATPase subunit